MNLKSKQLLYDLVARCFECKSKEEFEDIFDDLKQLIPFKSYGLVQLYISHGMLLNIDALQWFHEYPGFEEYYYQNRLFAIDPIFLNFLENPEREVFKKRFWADLYRSRRKKESATVDTFLKKVSVYRMESNGFTYIHRINPIRYFGISFAGKTLEDHEDVDYIMRCMAPALAICCNNIRIGKNRNLSEREFQIAKVFETCLRSREIARSFGVSVSTIEKYKAIIMGKTGTNRYELNVKDEDEL